MPGGLFSNKRFTDEDLSLISGRLSAPNAPPKDKAEAAAHRALMEEQRRHQRRMAVQEAKEVRRRREETERDTARWGEILARSNPTTFHSTQRARKETVSMWRRGLPPKVRAAVWELALGNPLGIDEHLYAVCAGKAKRRGGGYAAGGDALPTQLLSSPSECPADGSDSPTSPEGHGGGAAAYPYALMLGAAAGAHVPEETTLLQAFSREAYRLQRRYTNAHILEVMAASDAALADEEGGAAPMSMASCGSSRQDSAVEVSPADGALASSSSRQASASASAVASSGDGEAAAAALPQRPQRAVVPMLVSPPGADACLALGTLSEDGATLREDGDGGDDEGSSTIIASPRTHCKDNANAIAIDLHRTIITRVPPTARAQHHNPPQFTTIGGGGGGMSADECAASPPAVRGSLQSAGAMRHGSPSYSAASSTNNGGGIAHCEDEYSYAPAAAASRDAACLGASGTAEGGGPMSAGSPLPSPSSDVPAAGTPISVEGCGGVTSPTSGGSLYAGDGKALLVHNMCQDESLLRRISEVLRTFVEYRPDIGYVQGMSYLAAMILLHMADDRRAFIALATLLAKGHLRYFYTVQHRGIGAHIAVFEAVLQRGQPSLHRHFQLIGVVPQMYVIDWWMSLFSRTLPYEIAARCWDLFLLDEAYLYRISLCLLIYFGAIVHDEAPIDEILMFLSKIQNYSISEDRLFAIVADEGRYPPSIATIRGIMGEHLRGIEVD